jgi:hypothetical protein
VLLDAGADVNGFFRDSKVWPLLAATATCFDAGMAWLPERGASLTQASILGHTVAHALSKSEIADSIRHAAVAAEFLERYCTYWLRHVIAAEPSLLEARDRAGCTPLLTAAASGSEAGVAAVLELGANIRAVGMRGDGTLFRACDAHSLPVVRQLVAAGAGNAAVLPPGSRDARLVATGAVTAAVLFERGCGGCSARCGGSLPGNCADGLDILRAVLDAGGCEALGEDESSLASKVGSWLRTMNASQSISEGHALTILQALHAADVAVLARGPDEEHPILHAAAWANVPALVRWLVVVAGAKLEERNSDDHTPLMVACRCGSRLPRTRCWTAAPAWTCSARMRTENARRRCC